MLQYASYLIILFHIPTTKVLFTLILTLKKYMLKVPTEKITWNDKHEKGLSLGDKLADTVATGMGSWKFIIIQTVFVIIWMALNVVGLINHWDAYPFILLNLIFSTQAAYAAPIIMMSQNRQSERDRVQAQDDYQTNIDAKCEIEALQLHLTTIESQKLDKILTLLEELKLNNIKVAKVIEHKIL